MKQFLVLIGIIIISTHYSKGQVNIEPEKPKVSSLKVETIVNSTPAQSQNQPNYINSFSNIDRVQQNTEAVMKEVEQQQAIMNSQQGNIDTEEYNKEYLKLKYIENNYRNALKNIEDMLKGNKPLDLKKAVFLVEQAYLPSLSYEDFNNKINQIVEICKLKMLNDKLDYKNPLAINLAIQKVMSDTLKLKMIGNEIPIINYPFIYDFDDAWGEKDHANQFVSKLIYTKSGQCHSLPLLYLILAQELGTEAYLAFAPHHSYIKFRDESGSFYNFETTSGYLVSDNALMRSGFISSSAIKNRIFLDTISKKETIAFCLTDLAQGYYSLCGFGNGDFLMKAADLSLEYYPDRNLSAFMIKSNLYQAFFINSAKANGVKNFEEAMQNEELKKMWSTHDKYYRLVQDKGYSQITKQAYLNWVKSIQELSNKMTNEELFRHLKKSLEPYEN